MSSISTFVILLGLSFLASLASSIPLENHLQLSSEPQYDVGNPWIGYHTLKFTPNPFLLDALNPNILPQAKHLTQDDTSNSNPIEVVSTGESPISLPVTTETPWDPFSNLVTETIMGKRRRKLRRKIKGRRRISPGKSKSPRNPASRYKAKRNKLDESKRRFITRKPRGKVFKFFGPVSERPNPVENLHGEIKSVSSDFGKVDFLPIEIASINPPEYKWKGLKSGATVYGPIGPSHSLLPTLTPVTPVTTASSLEPSVDPAPPKAEGVVVRITTPPPIQPEVIESKKKLIPVDIILNHADKLSPTFFRNIIMKTMMDKLAEVEVAKNGPKLASSSEKKTDNQELS